MTQASDISSFSNPLFYDLISQELNVELNKLGYISDLYGVCSIGYDGEETFPEIYQNDGSKTNFRVMPDSTKSISFFIVSGEMIEIDEIGFAIPMALCLWFNLSKVFPSKSYDATTEVIKDVYKVVNKYGGYDISIDTTDPFPEFSQLSKQVAANTMLPYSAFRVNFTKNVQVCDF